MKNHMKSIEIMSLAVILAAYDKPEALALSYLMILNVEKELKSILDSVQKECDFKNDEQIKRNFIFTVETEISELKTLTIYCRESLREELEIPIELI